MLTQAEKDLIRLLKSCDLDKETTVAISVLCKTDENHRALINMIIARYDQTGKVPTEQEIQKMLLMLIGERKQENITSTQTEADTVQ